MQLYIKDYNIRVFVNFGLSNAQARTYLSLLEIGLAAVKEIAYNANVARPDTYRAIVDLQKIGIVEKIISVPTKYKPLPITDAIEILKCRRKNENGTLDMESLELIKRLEKKTYETEAPDFDSQFIIINGAEAIEHKLQNLLATSTSSACVIVPWQRINHWIAANYEIVKIALKKKVFIRLITEQPGSLNSSKEFITLKSNPYFEVRVIAEPPNFWLRIYDGANVFLTSAAKFETPEVFAVLSKHLGIVEMAQNYFNSLWFSAITLQDPSKNMTLQRQFDPLFANMNLGFSYNKLIFDDNGKPVDFVLLEVNSAFEKITGFGRNLLGKRITTVTEGLNFGFMIDAISRLVTKGKAVTFEHCFNSPQKTCSVHVYSPEEGYFAIIIEDITELNKSKEALKDTEEKYQHLAKNSRVAIFEMDYKTLQFLSVNDCMCMLTGYSREELLRMSPQELLDDESKELFQELIKNRWEGEKINDANRFGVIKKDGSKLWSILNSKLTYLDNQLDHAIVIAYDVTEIVKMEEALKKSEARYHFLFENIQEGYICCRLLFDKNNNPIDFVFLEINRAFEKFTGLKKEAVLGKKITAVMPDVLVSNSEFFEILNRISTSGKNEEFKLFFKSLNLWLSFSAFSHEKGHFVAIIC